MAVRKCPTCGEDLPVTLLEGLCPKCVLKQAIEIGPAQLGRDAPRLPGAHPASDSTDLAPRISDHELVRRIGKGAYGEVWLACNLMGAYRAVKVVHRSAFDSDHPFEREFLGIQKFEPVSRTHPGFIPILHVGQDRDEGYFYYIMELADDDEHGRHIQADRYKPRTLSSELARRGSVPLEECLQIGIALATALGHLHGHGLIHRDIKPSNIIFVDGVPKCADIGLVTEIGEGKSAVGTLGYMPPEAPGKPNGDLYSLGKLLYVMSTGKAAEAFPELPAQVGEAMDVPCFLRLNEVLLKACHRDPRERFQCADEMLAALRQAEGPGVQSTGQQPSRTEPSVGVDHSAQRVALVYKSNVEPDGRLLEFLRPELTRHGYEVFLDRSLTIGVEWAREIEVRIRSSDAVIVLLSAASIQSEMVTYEVEIAHESAQQHGKPALLPVRVAYTGPLSEPLACILGPRQQTTWEGPADNQRLLDQLLQALENPPEHRPGATDLRLEPVGGAVPLESQFYVVRPVDEDFRAAIARQDSIVLVKGARQMGKTSLLARGLQLAREAGARVVLTDFQMLNAVHLQSAEALFVTLAEWVANQLDLDASPETGWNPRAGPNINLQRFLRREVLGKLAVPLVWGLDEVDRLFTCSFGGEVFGLFRSWHNARSLDPTGPWSRLTLAIAYATEAHLFITDVNQSPFNVGTRLTLEDFTAEQVADLNRRYGSPLRTNAELIRFHQLVGGHPYLVRRGLHELVSRSLSLTTFAAQADREEGIFGDHLRRILVLLAKDQELLEVVRGLLRGRPCPTPESFYRLRTAGLVGGDSAQDAHPRCQLYETYLKRHLL